MATLNEQNNVAEIDDIFDLSVGTDTEKQARIEKLRNSKSINP
jgi:hypothetical protein